MPFEIFSPEEREKLLDHARVARTDDGSLRYLIQRINHGVQSDDGWLGKLRSHAAEIKDISERDNILDSLLKYATTAKTLQADRAGEVIQGALPKAWEKVVDRGVLPIKMKSADEKKEVSDDKIVVEMQTKSYQDFWDHYLQSVLIAFIENLNSKNTDSVHRLAKPTLYLLARLKRMIRKDKLFGNAYYLTKFESYIAKQIEQLNNLPPVFGLDEVEAKYMSDERDFIANQVKEIVALRKKFESNPLYARYVHVHPDVLLQFSQMIDYSYSYIADMATKKGIFTSTISTDGRIVLEMLQQKRRDLAVVMAFQEELRAKYGCSDFIQVLHHLLQNKEPELLPTQKFYDFVANHSVAIANYDGDPNAPRLLTREESMRWRSQCRFLSEIRRATTPVVAPLASEAKVLRRPKEPDPHPFCARHEVLYMVYKGAPLAVDIPHFALPAIFSPKHIESKASAVPTPSSLMGRLFGTAKSTVAVATTTTPSVTREYVENDLFAFFIQQQQMRTDFHCCLIRYKDTLLSLHRKVLKRNESLLSIFVKTPGSSENNEREERFLHRITDLRAQNENMERYFAREEALLREALAKPISLEERKAFMAYQEALNQAKEEVKHYLAELLSNWDRGLHRHARLLQGANVDRFKVQTASLSRCM